MQRGCPDTAPQYPTNHLAPEKLSWYPANKLGFTMPLQAPVRLVLITGAESISLL